MSKIFAHVVFKLNKNLSAIVYADTEVDKIYVNDNTPIRDWHPLTVTDGKVDCPFHLYVDEQKSGWFRKEYNTLEELLTVHFADIL